MMMMMMMTNRTNLLVILAYELCWEGTKPTNTEIKSEHFSGGILCIYNVTFAIMAPYSLVGEQQRYRESCLRS